MRRFSALVLSLVLAATLCCGFASARASAYLTSYNAKLYTGDSSGQLRLDFDVTASRAVTSYGISKVWIYSEDGDLVKTITGSKSNGLLSSSGRFFANSYYTNVTAGERYYAEITFIGKDANGSDSKPYTTNVATAAK